MAKARRKRGGTSGGATSKGSRREGAARRPEAGPAPGSAGGVLARIEHALAERDQAEAQLRARVADARALGLSWHQVGGALGMTSEGARQRYHVRAPAPPAAAKK